MRPSELQMSTQNGSSDHAPLAQVVAILTQGEAVHVRINDDRQRRRLRLMFARHAAQLGFRAAISDEGDFRTVRWIRPELVLPERAHHCAGNASLSHQRDSLAP
jgi:hypothetical protein